MSHCCSSGCHCSHGHHGYNTPPPTKSEKVATGAIVGSLVGGLVGTIVHQAYKQSKKEKNKVVAPQYNSTPSQQPAQTYQPPPQNTVPQFQHSAPPPSGPYMPAPSIYPSLPQQSYHSGPPPTQNYGYYQAPRLPPCNHGIYTYGCQHCEGWRW
ncbi:uncharacterized protein LOC143204051 [Rhynchophorus ferrugineus]|uniref:uncharacterized protein LOC143204051 n=1 Tax=Rhynchophorus ferrugineus TaxID=354439 RepID=UPI003FCE8175